MTSPGPAPGVAAYAPNGVGEIEPGTDLVAVLLEALHGDDHDLATLSDGDIVCVTSKIVSKSEGRLVPGTDRAEAITSEAVDVVAQRGPTSIVRTRHGLTMAAAGVDNSNIPLGTLALLPVDPDASARSLRENLQQRTGRNLSVVVTDTAGRAWRQGQTDIAIGAAGIRVLDDHAGRVDAHGNPLAVTAPAVADEVAGLAELASGKLGGRPYVVVRGLAEHVLAPDEHGPGAAALVRPLIEDLFALGSREAVIRALAGRHEDRPLFGAPAEIDEMLLAIRRVTGREARLEADGALTLRVEPSAATVPIAPLALAMGWTLEVAPAPGAPTEVVATVRPAGP